MEKLVQKRIFHGSTCQVMALACAKKGRSPAQGTSGQSTAHTAKKRCHQFIVECAQWHATTITTISLATTVTATMTMVGKRLNGFFGELLFCWDAGIQNAYSRVLGWDVLLGGSVSIEVEKSLPEECVIKCSESDRHLCGTLPKGNVTRSRIQIQWNPSMTMLIHGKM